MPLNFTGGSAVSQQNQERFTLTAPLYQIADIVLNEDQQRILNELLGLVRYETQIFDVWGLGRVIKRGRGLKVNLYGYPGTGKTMVAHAIAHALNRKILEVNYAEIESKFVGETSKNIVALFHEAKEKNAVLLFDEADALLSRRVTDMHSSSDVSVNQTRSVLLKILDEYEGVCIFTTNFIQNYDTAFMRRITRHIYFPLPNEAQRKELWRHYLVPSLPAEVDSVQLAEQFTEVSGSDIANAVLNSAIRAASAQMAYIPQSFFATEIQNIIDAKKINRESN